MKKITFLILFLVTSWHINAQTTCIQTFTVSGQDDGPTVLTINAADINCSGIDTPTSIKLVNAAGSLASGLCTEDGSSWFGFDLSVNGGAAVTGCAAAFNDVIITGFNTLTITSHDDDDYSDGVTITISVEVTFTPTVVPNCTALASPVNGAVNVLSSVISWPIATSGPTGYKLNVGTTPGATNVLNLFDVGNVLTYDLGVLNPGTTYYVTVVPYNNIGNAVGPCTESSFTTCGITAAPATENFSTYTPSCWQEADNGDAIAGPATFGSSSWGADGFGNVGTTGAINYNVYTTGANDWIVSPLYSIPAVGYELKFDAAAAQYANATAPTTAWEADDSIQVLVSTGTTNWTVLYTYNDTNTPSNIGTTNIIDLDAYAGQNVRFAFRAIEGADNGGADIDFSIDNFELRLTPACPEPIGLAVSNLTNNSAVITWSATSGNYEYVLDNVATNPAGLGTPTTATTYNASGLTQGIIYYLHVRTNCGGIYSIWSTISFIPPPAGSTCTNSIVISSLPFTTNDNTANYGNDYANGSSPCSSFYMNGDDVVYTFTPSANVVADILLSNLGSTWSGIHILDGCPGTSPNCVAFMGDSATTDRDLQDVNLVAGTTYYIVISTWATPQSTTYTLTITDSNLATDSFNNANFSYYPNPVKNVLNLSYNENISDVAVYNLLGQQVIAKAINANQSQIDMSHLSSGAYMVKVTADNQVKMIKVIKE